MVVKTAKDRKVKKFDNFANKASQQKRRKLSSVVFDEEVAESVKNQLGGRFGVEILTVMKSCEGGDIAKCPKEKIISQQRKGIRS